MRLAEFMVVVGLVATAACGGGPCESEFSGRWIGTTRPDSIELSDSCEFRYQGVDGCLSTGTSAAPIADQGNVKVSITASTGGLCLPAGDYVCAYSASSSTLTFACGGGSTSYGR